MAGTSGLEKHISSIDKAHASATSRAITQISILVALTTVYFIAGKIGLRLATIHPSATAVWAPTGIALSACLLFGRWTGPAIFAGAFLVNLTTAGSVATSLGIASGNTLEALVGSYLLDRFANGCKVFEQTQDVFRFLLLAAIISTSLSATVGVSSLYVGGYAKWPDYKWIWLTWWLGDAAGDLIVAPLLLLWAANASISGKERRLEAIGLSLALVFTGGAVFGGWLPLPKQQYPLDFLCFPALLWAAFRFGPRETATASFILSAIAIVGTLNGLGPFARGTRNEGLLLLQTFAGLTGLMSIAVATAVAERRRLDETRAQLAAIVDSSEDGIIGLNLQGCITSWNESATRIFGVSAADALGQPVTIIVPPEAQMLESEAADRFERGEAIRQFETVGLRKDGGRIDISLTISPIRGNDGCVIGASRIARDITGEKRARREREALLYAQRQAREAAEADSRAKDEFLAMLSHELRNPLHAMILALRLFEDEQVSRDTAARTRGVISRQAEHLTRLVDDLLDVARVTSGRIVLIKNPTNLQDCVLECVTAFRETRQLERHMVETHTEPLWVNADRDRMVQIVTNLLSNALKYTPAGGKIAISVHAEDGKAVMSVKDDGIGIDASLVPHIFDLFVRGQVGLERAPGGLGVGLTLVKRLVELHGGRIEARSDGPGKGSDFVICFSRIPPPLELQPTRALGSLAAGMRRRILLIEDNSDVRESLRNLLELWHHEVYEAADGRAGIDAVLKLRPDVALIDIGLPALDGYEVARRLRASIDSTHTVLIALTGYARGDDRQRATDAGFDGYLTKPVEPKRLIELITTLSPRVPKNSGHRPTGESS
jgi:PAS domain S-box-containing protein